jgi:hypothetical protein
MMSGTLCGFRPGVFGAAGVMPARTAPESSPVRLAAETWESL